MSGTGDDSPGQEVDSGGRQEPQDEPEAGDTTEAAKSKDQGGCSVGRQSPDTPASGSVPETAKPGNQGKNSAEGQKSQPCTAATPESTKHKTPLCRISMFLAGLSFYIMNGLFHKFPDQIFQLGDEYRRVTSDPKTAPKPVDQGKNTVGGQAEFDAGTAESEAQVKGPDEDQETKSAQATPQPPKPTNQGKSSAVQQTESGGSASDPTPNPKGQGVSSGEERETADAPPPPETPQPIDHKVWLSNAAMSTLDIYDTQEDGNDDNAIDYGDANGNNADREDPNKGIIELFEKKPLTGSSSVGQETGHTADWSSIHHPCYPPAILDIIDDANPNAKCGPSGKHWFKGGNSSGAQKNYYLWNTSWSAIISYIFSTRCPITTPSTYATISGSGSTL